MNRVIHDEPANLINSFKLELDNENFVLDDANWEALRGVVFNSANWNNL